MRASQAVFIAMLAIAASIPALIRAAPGGGDALAPPHEIAWPTSFEGRPLTQLPLSGIEQRFAAQFPGQIGRFTDGERIVIVRVVQEPTRLLHPASDCFRGLGYRTDPPRVVEGGSGIAWSCLLAQKDGKVQRCVSASTMPMAGPGPMFPPGTGQPCSAGRGAHGPR